MTARKASATNPPAEQPEVDHFAEGADGAPEPVVVNVVIGDEFADLLADVERDQITWIPKGAGSTLAGRVKDLHTIETRFGTRTVTVVETNSDPTSPLVRFAWLGSVLETAYARENVQPGDKVAVRHLGEVESENGTYQNWRVIVRKGSGYLTRAQVDAQLASLKGTRLAAEEPF